MSSTDTDTDAGADPNEATGADTDTGTATPDIRRSALVDGLRAELGDAVLDSHLDPGREVWVRVASDSWEQVGRASRDGLGFRYFCYLSVIDWLPSPFGRSMDAEVDNVLEHVAAKEAEPMTHGVTGGETRFQLLARLYSIDARLGVNLKADVPEDTLTMASWTKLFGGANWHEREAFEMFGILFDGHPSLRKLYLPGGFEGHPMRKDFPLLARMVRPWPGIVDVEAMPGVADDDGGSSE